MKRTISIILATIIVSSSLLCSNTVMAFNGNKNNILKTKMKIAQKWEKKYGESLFSDASDSGYWSYEDTEDTNELTDLDGLTSNLGDSVISPLWGNSSDDNINNDIHAKGTHDYIIKKVSEDIPNNYINLVYQISKRCDTEYGSNCGSNFCTAFHGGGNYIANIAYLWKFARLIGKKNSTLNNTNDSTIKKFITDMADEAYFSMSAFTSKDGTVDVIYDLSKFAPKFVIKYYKTTSIASVSGQSWAGRCKYIIWGMIAHSVADVFAHKVMLKPEAADYLMDKNVTYNASTMLERTFFYKYFNENNSIKENLAKDIRNKKVALVQIKNYIDTTLSDDKKTAIQKESHKNYADNPEFYPKRINEAILSLTCIFESYKNVTSTKDIIDYTHSCIIPCYGFTLYKFDAYAEELGV